MSEEDIELPRRRSARIIALEEKRERQKKAMEEARKNSAESYKGKGKGKAVSNGEGDDYGFIDDEDDEEDEHALTKKRGRKSRPLNQLISLTQPVQEGQHPECPSTSRRHGLPRILPKDTLEFVLDLLQRQDTNEFFAQPINSNQDYHTIVKEPMDFGTMRAKVHENMYTDMQQFERDVYLICSNAMNANPSSTDPHKVAEAINQEASKMFHALSADPEFFDMEYFGLDEKKLSRGRKCRGRSKSSGHPRRPPSKPRGGNNSGAKNSKGAQVDKRQTYCPPRGDSTFSGVLDGPKSNLQFHKPSCYYQDSVARFVEGMGPTVKKCAARKVESLRRGQIMCGEAPRPNSLANFVDTNEDTLEPTSTVPPLPPPPTPPMPPRSPTAATRLGRGASYSMHYPIASNRPLKIPGCTPQAPPHQETKNINLDRTGDYKGKKVAMDARENWDAYAASILSGYCMDNGGGGRRRGLNLNGEGSSSGSNKASSFHQNRSSFLAMSSSFQEANQNQNPSETSNARNNLVNAVRNVTPNEFSPRVWPSIVISGPQAQSRTNGEPISSSTDRLVPLRPTPIRPSADYSLSGQPLFSRQNLMKQEQEPIPRHTNLSDEHSLLSQNMTEFDFSLLRQALWSQQTPVEQQVTANNLTWQSLMPQNDKPATVFLNEDNPLSWKFFMTPQQTSQEEAMNMTAYNFSGQQPLLSQQSRSNSNGYTLSSGGRSLVSQQRREDVGPTTGWPSFVPQSDLIAWESFMSHQRKPQDHALMSQAAVAGYNDNLNLSQQVAKWTEEGISNLYNSDSTNQPEDFRTIWAPIDLNNIPFTEHASIYTTPTLFDNSAGDMLMQPEPELAGQLNPQGLFPRQTPRPLPSSASLEMPMGLNILNYYVGNAMVGQPTVAGRGEGPSTVHLQWGDDVHQPNLALQL